MKKRVEALLRQVIDELVSQGQLPAIDSVGLSLPVNRDFGDYTTNVAMIAASKFKRNPRELAGVIKEAIEANAIFAAVEVAGPGFINLKLKPEMWTTVLAEIHEHKASFGQSDFGQNQKVQVEFVSANPTGPLHVGHGRGAAVGDTLARILKAAGFDVQREYYINDVGNQMNTLGRSVLLRMRQLDGQTIEFPTDAYQGDYIKDLAAELKDQNPAILAMAEDEAVAVCRKYAGDAILSGIDADLKQFNVSFDHWFSEGSLYVDDKVAKTIDYLNGRDQLFEEDGALWFKTTAYGDDKDRVLRKQDGALTYFTPDIAYHKDKLDRGFMKIIDIWGADHHGYVPRMTAAIQALGAEKERFQALLIQLVSLVRDGEPVSMSTRSGEFVTLKDVVDEVGKDAARYFFMMRKCDAQLVFDLELAKKKSDENPVFYIQYAHARICSIIRNAAEQGLSVTDGLKHLNRLDGEDDQNLIKLMAGFPDMVAGSARDLEPHRVSFYVQELATAFHSFYNKNRVISDDRELSSARLALVDAVRQVIANALDLMGISAPEKM